MTRPAVDSSPLQFTSDSLRTRMCLRRSAASRPLALQALAALAAIAPASAQLVSYTARNGQTTAFCGAAVGGPGEHHTFATPSVTHDSISVADPGIPGQMSPSSAASHLDVVPAPNGISITQSGAVMRGPILVLAPGASSDTRDEWTFSVAAPAHFTFSVTLSATNSAGPMAPQSYLFIPNSGGAQIIPDPSTPPGAFGGSISTPGTLAVTATGTLTAGQYIVSLNGSAVGTNVWPHSATFDNSLDLALDCGIVTSYCTSGTTTHGCNAVIQGNGAPSASASSGFTFDVTQMEGGVQGLIFYGTHGRAAVPWGTSSSFICVQSPTQRTPPQLGAGTAGACDGSMSVDWCAFVSSHPNALGAPFSAGQVVEAQGWFRDPPSPKGTMLSNAVEFVVCP